MGVQCKGSGGNLKARWDFGKLSFEAKNQSELYEGTPLGVSISQVGMLHFEARFRFFLYFLGRDFFSVQMNNVVH